MTRRKTKAPATVALRSLTQGDGRRRESQAYRTLRRELIADSGGPGEVSAARLAVIDTLSAAVAICRSEFTRYLAMPDHDPSRFASLGNLVLGAARTLGMKRHARTVSLADLLNGTDAPLAKAPAMPDEVRA